MPVTFDQPEAAKVRLDSLSAGDWFLDSDGDHCILSDETDFDGDPQFLVIKSGVLLAKPDSHLVTPVAAATCTYTREG